MNEKFGLFVAILLAAMFLGNCKKDNPVTEKSSKAATLKAAIITVLSGQDSISTFAAKFKDVDISEDEAAGGLTVFAPVNQAFTTALTAQSRFYAGGTGILMSAGASAEATAQKITLADSSDVRDYIIKGLVKATDLVNGKKLTALSGEALTVTQVDGDLRLNGVLVSGAGLSTSGEVIVHTLSGLLKKKPTITIAVLDASLWSVNNPKGLPAEGATVSLYSSQKDYADGRDPAYFAKTQSDGLAKFKDVTAGTYYITATQEEMSNVFKEPSLWNNDLTGGVYTGYSFNSVFQSSEEVVAWPQINAAPGNPRYIDVNGDGKVDQNDFVALPAQSVEAHQGANVSSEILIGYSNNSWRTTKDLTEAESALENAYWITNFEFLNYVMLDAIMSDDVNNVQGKYMVIDRFGFGPTDNNFTERWKNAYQSGIPSLNRIIRDIPGLANSPDNQVIMAQAKALRGYVYLNLLMYYQNIPLIQGVILPYNTTNTKNDDILNLIISDLQAAANDLPASWSSDQSYKINRSGANGLLARAYLYQKDYAHALEASQKVINSGLYQLLGGVNDVFRSVENKESIWNISGLYANADFKAFFTKGTYCPVIRLPEIYLTAAESALEINNIALAIQYANILNARRGVPLIASNASTNQLSSALRSLWQQEMILEGNRFVCLNRWGIAQQVLASQGFQAPKNNLWPVPQSFLNDFPMLKQNAGY